jgi:HprK-related kinase A
LIVADLSPSALARRLRTGGLRLRTGPVVTVIRSGLPAVRRGVALHYARHSVEDDASFADFHVSIDRPATLRRWIEPQVVFRFDGTQPFAPLPGDQGFPMLEWGLNWCVSSHCHQYLIVHAAVLERDGRALILPAPSGSGKSTLCAGLTFAGGWRLLSDELMLLDPIRGTVVPLPRPLSLKNDSIEVLAALAPRSAFGEVVHETTKGRVAHLQPPAQCVADAHMPALPAWVVLPRYVPGSRAALRALPRANAFMALVDNAFNYVVQGRRGFHALADLIDRSKTFEFSYADLHEASAAFERLATSTATAIEA